MPRRTKTLTQMNTDSIRYLEQNTDVTFTSAGSMSRGLVEATNLEISRLQEYVIASQLDIFLDTSSGLQLDLIGENFGVRRLPSSAAFASIEDGVVQFNTASGGLGDHFPNPANANQGLIPAGITVQTTDGNVKFKVSEDVVFPKKAKSVFVSVIADEVGEAFNVGAGRLVSHDGPAAVTVTNIKSISNGTGLETDKQYKFRISNNLVASATANETAIRLAALGNPDVQNISLRNFARGAGTFDVFLIPVGNTVSSKTLQLTQLAIDRVAAFGINSRVTEPDYIRFKLIIQLIPQVATEQGTIDSNRIRARNAVLNYFSSLPVGGELIINQLRASVINSVNQSIKDIKILELCLNDRPHTIRNHKLIPDQLFTPDTNQDFPPVEIV